MNIEFLFVFLSMCAAKPNIVQVEIPYKEKVANVSSHLELSGVRWYCANRDRVCTYNATQVCGVRVISRGGTEGEGEGEPVRDLKDFHNSCYMFLSNMCDHPGNEYNIAWDSNCKNYTMARRRTDADISNDVNITDADVRTHIELVTDNMEHVGEDATSHGALNVTDYNGTGSTFNATNSTITGALRSAPLYDVDTAFDYHDCPLSCPDIYSPVCITVNRGFGLYFKYFTFINHCLGDLYYCKHFEEFEPPPFLNEELVLSSPLSWSFCGSSRYMQFARFSEVVSSMGHYGWLAGHYSPAHILEPHQRIPGFG